jgi:hypothetical protein
MSLMTHLRFVRHAKHVRKPWCSRTKQSPPATYFKSSKKSLPFPVEGCAAIEFVKSVIKSREISFESAEKEDVLPLSIGTCGQGYPSICDQSAVYY